MSTDNEHDLRRTAESMRRQLTSEHLDEETTLVAYVDDELDPTEREVVDEHLAGCTSCRDIVSDLSEMRRSLAPVRRFPNAAHWLIAASLAGLALLGGLQFLNRTPARPVHRYANADWQALVRSARAAGRLDAPAAWSALQSGPDVIRGPQSHGTEGTFIPSGSVVESQRPAFSWPATTGAEYVVRVSVGLKEVAHSDVLREAAWVPASPLARGLTYMWQVELRRGGRTALIPVPPHPPLLFTIVNEKAAGELADARRSVPDDHFLLGLLYARAGVREEAQREMARWLAGHPGDATARELLNSLEQWKPAT